MRKIFWRKHGPWLEITTYSIWIDDVCVAYGIDSEKQVELICSIARLALEKCGVKTLNSFDSQN